ncbi:MAG: acyltransferase [Clostridia bacterium]|nr:acyltransferase [Clostridia bacterium]
MVFFITFLRAIATCLITNSHYTGIYPTDLIANGGLLGDVVFFAVSGYCLYHVKGNFFRWYGKRVWRCYLPVILITAFYMILGFYSLETHSALWWYVYPTYYHFVASIVVLYVPFFVVMKIDFLRKHIPLLMIGIGVVYLILYVFVYDKSFYHIDNVREPFIRFLFMECMLLGAYFKQNDARIRNHFSWWYLVVTGILFVGYFASKLLFSRHTALAQVQIINQFVIFTLLVFLMESFSGLDGKLSKLPNPIKKLLTFLANITLEIYVVQYVLIDLIRDLGLVFPINWIVLTASIIAAAFALHVVCRLIMRATDAMILKLFHNKKEEKLQ